VTLRRSVMCPGTLLLPSAWFRSLSAALLSTSLEARRAAGCEQIRTSRWPTGLAGISLRQRDQCHHEAAALAEASGTPATGIAPQAMRKTPTSPEHEMI
jgi:hypothetical protein